MRQRAKTEFLVGYKSRYIYRFLLLDEEMGVGTRDVIFDETLFSHSQANITPNDDAIPIIDFKMVSDISDFVLDNSDNRIRNNESGSQILEDELQSLIQNDKQQEQDNEVPHYDVGFLTPEDSFVSNYEGNNKISNIGSLSENFDAELSTPPPQNIDIL